MGPVQKNQSTSGISFAFETTLSGKAYAQRIGDWQAMKYVVKLIFLQLPTVEQAIARVQLRVQQGGHAIPAAVIRRRFLAGLHNFETLYSPLVDEWQRIDNGGLIPRLLSEGGRA